MPFPKNWVEELVSEWLLLKGYVALSNVRLRSGRGGGVGEADVIGLKLVKEAKGSERGEKRIAEVLEIIHVETGSLTGGFEKNLETIRRKFSPERVRTIKEIAIDIIQLESALGSFRLGYSRLGVSDTRYKPVYIASYVARSQISKLRSELKKNNIELLTLKEALREIIKDIDKWKMKQVKKRFRATKNITLPESWWLLNLIDYMKTDGFIK